ncbi:MAG: YidC/Oxa1 family membrane protein insertase [Synergistaceae bacterium]|jgi:YidC/Oxa1 family membrane protein insertase|nr:YidC/Oxa1 family membrane protein insertase [Synergistaceae bacterium]
MLSILGLMYNVTGSYGLAIILLTIIVRLLLYPLTHKQMVSMGHMQKLQPRLKLLQEKYANDKTKLNEEMMRLYRENNVNPLAGCLPILVQLPIMILLFGALMRFQVEDSTFFGIYLGRSLFHGLATAMSVVPPEGVKAGFSDVWSGLMSNPAGLANIHFYLPSLLLTIAIIFMTWLQQRLSGSANNPQMATMNVVMPVMMGFICLGLPGGILVYWGTTSLIGIVQQWIAARRTKKEIDTKPVLYKNKPMPGQSNTTLQSEADEEDEEYEDDWDEDDEDEEYEYEDEEDEYEEGKK